MATWNLELVPIQQSSLESGTNMQTNKTKTKDGAVRLGSAAISSRFQLGRGSIVKERLSTESWQTPEMNACWFDI